MDRDRLLDELYENLYLVQLTVSRLEDINEDLPIDSWEKIDSHIVDAKSSLEKARKLYEKEIERLGGNI